MAILTKDEIAEILKLHKAYLVGDVGGKRANIYGADLRSADLRSANLYGANLYGADLYDADLYGADLRSADLRSANLRSANLYGANLYGANLGGVKTPLAKMLFLLGACGESIAWVEGHAAEHSAPMALLARANPKWKDWLEGVLGGEPTFERLQHVVAYVTGGRGVPE